MTVLRVTSEGGRVREAVASMAADGAPLAVAFRKALPFLAKPGFRVTFDSAASSLFSEALASLGSTAFPAHFDVLPGGASGVLVFDEAAIALLVDGLLGGGGAGAVELASSKLSPAQKALMGRVAGSVLEEMSSILHARAGIRVAHHPGAAAPDCEAGYLVCSWEIGCEGRTGRVLLALPRDAAVTRVRVDGPSENAPDPRVATALRSVELDLVIELGRATVPLADVARLRVGSTVLVDTQVGGTVTVRADGRPLLTGEPTTSDGRIALRVRSIGHGA